MNNFLSSHIDMNKIFIINRSEIEGRWDPNQYHPERMMMIEKLKHTNTICVLKSVVDFSKNITLEIKNSDIYVGLENILSDTGEYVQRTDKQTVSTAAIFRKGHILFPKLRPYLNKVFLANFDGICSTEFHVLSVKKGVLAEFLHIYLLSDIVVRQTKHLMTGNTLPRLQTDDIYNLPVPIIPIEEQQKIVDLYQSACQLKQQKEAQATAFLASIDDYLLGELSIILPEQDNSLKGRMFTTLFSEVVGNRIAPKLYDNNTLSLRRAIKNTPLRTSRLKDLIIHNVSGDWGEEEVSNENYTKCLVVRATEFDNDYNLNLDNTRVKHRFIRNDKLVKMDMRANDLLIEKSGGSPDQPVGRIAIVNQDYLTDNKLSFSNFIHKIRVNTEQVSPEYLFCFLKTMHSIKLTDAMQSQTNGIRNLIMSNYFNQRIPLPTLEKQNEIAKHIRSIRAQASGLQKEAQEIVEKAKKEVEQIILGE